MAQEHQEYIQTKVNPILENLVTQVLLERPENPVPFMVRWLANQSPQAKEYFAGFGMGEAEKLRTEVKVLQEEVRGLELKLGRTPEAPAAEAAGEAAGGAKEDPKSRPFDLLSKCPLFGALDEEQRRKLAGCMKEKAVESGERLVKEGDAGAAVFVVEKGIAECKKDGKVIRTCGVCDYFGELELIDDVPCAASVDAKEALVAWELDKETFVTVARDAIVANRKRCADALGANTGAIAELGAYARGLLADRVQKQEAKAGADVIKQGDDGEKFYIVEDGELGVTLDGKEVRTLTAGMYFGELSLLRGAKCSATVAARTDAKLLWVGREAFQALLGPVADSFESHARTYS